MAGEVRDGGLKGSPSYDGGDMGGEKATAAGTGGGEAQARMKGRAEERHLSGGKGGGRGDNGGIEKRARERSRKIWLHLAWELAPLPVVHEEVETQKPPYPQK